MLSGTLLLMTFSDIKIIQACIKMSFPLNNQCKNAPFLLSNQFPFREVTKVLPVGLGLLTDTVAISLTLLTEADAA
jgi:hypothetical protein